MDASCADLAEPDAVECGRGEGGVTDGGPVVRRHAPDGVAPVQCVLKVRPLVTVCLVTKVDPPVEVEDESAGGPGPRAHDLDGHERHGQGQSWSLCEAMQGTNLSPPIQKINLCRPATSVYARGIWVQVSLPDTRNPSNFVHRRGGRPDADGQPARGGQCRERLWCTWTPP